MTTISLVADQNTQHSRAPTQCQRKQRASRGLGELHGPISISGLTVERVNEDLSWTHPIIPTSARQQLFLSAQCGEGEEGPHVHQETLQLLQAHPDYPDRLNHSLVQQLLSFQQKVSAEGGNIEKQFKKLLSTSPEQSCHPWRSSTSSAAGRGLICS